MTATRVEAEFVVAGESTPFVVRTLRGRDAISELYRFELSLHTENPSLDFDELVGRAVHLVLRRADDERHLHGILAELELERANDHVAWYRAVVVPQAWLLDLGADYRVFASQTAPAIVESLLKERGVGRVRFAIAGEYETREVTIQYHESEWAFASRLLEEEGIHYYFEHDAEGCTLVITDAGSTHDDIGGDPHLFFRTDGFDNGGAIETFEFSQRLLPSKVTVRDYPFEQPLGTLEQTASSNGPSSDAGAVFEFPDWNAQKRLSALQVAKKRARGQARAITLAAGFVFELDSHPRAAFNQRWLLTAVTLDGGFPEHGGGAHLGASFEAVPASVDYRPERKTRRPKIVGAQMATVLSPAQLTGGTADSADVQVDDQGRVLVRFQWDRSSDGACWLPVAQIAASRGFGSMNLPRVGDSVLVEFLDGDPDRPIVSASLYHKVNTPAYALPKNRTRTVFRDASSPGGGGYNELSFESAAGQEEVFLRAQKNLKVQVQNDASTYVAQNDSLQVDGNRTVSVTGFQQSSVTGNDTQSVLGAQQISIVGDQALVVTGARQQSVVGDHSEVTTGNYAGAIEGNETLATLGDQSRVVEGSRTLVVEGNDTATIVGTRSMAVEGNHQLVVDGTTFETHGALQISVAGDTALKGSGEIRVESDTVTKIGAPNIYVAASSNLYLRAKDSIELQVGDAKITIKDGHVYLTSGDSHKTLTGDTVKFNC